MEKVRGRIGAENKMIPAWPARHSKCSQNSKEGSRASPISEHHRLRKFPSARKSRREISSWPRTRVRKSVIMTPFFRQYYTNRQEKCWSNLPHKQHHRGATTRCHAGIVTLTSTKSLENDSTDQKPCILSRKVYFMAIG